MSKSYIVSMDPAQLHDYSALAVLEKTDATYRILSLKHKQHLPYTEIVEWAKKVFLNPKFSKDVTSPPVFVLDIGGVGMAIKDMMSAAKVETVGIQYTGGAAVSREGDNWHVSKSFIVGKFLAAWDEGRVLMPSGASFLDMFQGELRAFRGEMSAQGRAKFEAEQGEHDDLVMAVGQGVWYGEQAEPVDCGWGVSRLFGGSPETRSARRAIREHLGPSWR